MVKKLVLKNKHQAQFVLTHKYYRVVNWYVIIHAGSSLDRIDLMGKQLSGKKVIQVTASPITNRSRS